MKKFYSFFLASLLALSVNAQLTTHSNYDVNADGKVNVSDATETVTNYVSGKSADRQVVDATELNAVLKSIADNISEINTNLKDMSNRLASLEAKVGGDPVDDPYNGHEYVDLGLPSGLKWATMNVGAKTPEEYGDYFAWGDTEPYYTEGHSQDSPCSNWKNGKTSYDWSNYTWCNGSNDTMTKYCNSSDYGSVDNMIILESADDAAFVNWGGSWRMPTKAAQDELRNSCTWTWTTQKGVNGYKVSSKTNMNSIFLPAAGFRQENVLIARGEHGAYRSSSLFEGYSITAYIYSFDSSRIDWSFNARYQGSSIRAVCQ